MDMKLEKEKHQKKGDESDEERDKIPPNNKKIVIVNRGQEL